MDWLEIVIREQGSRGGQFGVWGQGQPICQAILSHNAPACIKASHCHVPNCVLLTVLWCVAGGVCRPGIHPRPDDASEAGHPHPRPLQRHAVGALPVGPWHGLAPCLSYCRQHMAMTIEPAGLPALMCVLCAAHTAAVCSVPDLPHLHTCPHAIVCFLPCPQRQLPPQQHRCPSAQLLPQRRGGAHGGGAEAAGAGQAQCDTRGHHRQHAPPGQGEALLATRLCRPAACGADCEPGWCHLRDKPPKFVRVWMVGEVVRCSVMQCGAWVSRLGVCAPGSHRLRVVGTGWTNGEEMGCKACVLVYVFGTSGKPQMTTRD